MPSAGEVAADDVVVGIPVRDVEDGWFNFHDCFDLLLLWLSKPQALRYSCHAAINQI